MRFAVPLAIATALAAFAAMTPMALADSGAAPKPPGQTEPTPSDASVGTPAAPTSMSGPKATTPGVQSEQGSNAVNSPSSPKGTTGTGPGSDRSNMR